MQRTNVSYRPLAGCTPIPASLVLSKDTFEVVTEDGQLVNKNPYFNLAKLEHTYSGLTASVYFVCKNFANFTLEMKNDTVTISILSQLHLKATISDINELPAFTSPLVFKSLFSRSYGWSIYNKVEDFTRMCGFGQNEFMQSDVNLRYQVCSSYPNIVFVPKNIRGQNVLIGSARFRSLGRFPVLSYYYASKSTCIMRCAQPRSGLRSKCFEDLQLLRLVAEMKGANSKLHIFDARPKLNAMANKVAGKGFENINDYYFCQIEFMDIPNIHVVRDSLNKYLDVIRAKSDSVVSLWNSINATGWPDYLCRLIKAACSITSKLHFDQENCLVHCSDGWDRTSQLCALASLLLDPFYRTLHGFVILIEKEFVSFGHKFCARIGFLPGNPQQISPIFVQFLECVYQLSLKYSYLFQFNERLLLTIAHHLAFCEFGTFLVDSESERVAQNLAERTESLWNYVFSQADDYLNPFYSNQSQTFVQCSFIVADFKIWRKLYLAKIPELQESEDFSCIAESLIEKHLRDSLYKSKGLPPPSSWEVIPSNPMCMCGRDLDFPLEKSVHCANCGKVFCKLCLVELQELRFCSVCVKLDPLSLTTTAEHVVT